MVDPAALPAPTLARRQQRVEELCAAALRALAGDATLHFRGARLHRGREPLPLFAPHLLPLLQRDDFVSFRGAADGVALRLRQSDEALHRSLAPTDGVTRMLFDLLEQFRVEAAVPLSWPGVASNLAHCFEQWSVAFLGAGLADSARGILFFTVAQMCRARVTAQPIPEAAQDPIEATRAAMGPLLGHDLALLRQLRTDQSAYAVPALAICRSVADLLLGTDEEPGERSPADREDTRFAFGLRIDLQAAFEEGIAEVVLGHSRVWAAQKGQYRVFTRAHDRLFAPAALVRSQQLQELREQLDRRIAGQGMNLPRLARELKALLALPQRDGWDDGQEAGRIDGRRLTQLIASPTERRLFRTEHVEPVADVVVGFLIDCSGSMRQHIESVAMLVDSLARALEMAGAASEVLGFTTGAWDGGRAQRDWQRAGRPDAPGRLNEVWHLVFKDADTPWRRARHGMAALLRPDLFREGIDGEAVDWACQRLRQRDEARKLLVVVSDGCPMDRATQRANDEHYLDQHLCDVVVRQSRPGDLQIMGLGVGLDLSPFYSHCQAVDLSRGVGHAVFSDVLRLLAGGRRR